VIRIAPDNNFFARRALEGIEIVLLETQTAAELFMSDPSIKRG
jgi:hypothetical protein